MKFCLFIVLNFFAFCLPAQTNKADSTRIKDSIAKAAAGGNTNTKEKKPDGKADEKKGDKDPVDTSNKQDNIYKIPAPSQHFVNWAMLIAVIGLLFVMIWGLIGAFSYVKKNSVFIGHNTIKLIGFVLLLPSICIIALISQEAMSGTVLATLLGTIAGYVLSRPQENDSDRSRTGGGGGNNSNPPGGGKGGTPNPGGAGNNQEDITTLKNQIEDLKKAIADLKGK